MTLSPIINTTKPIRLDKVGDILPHIDPGHGGARLLTHLISQYPRLVSRESLIAICGYGLGHPQARFEWWVLRVNDTLPLVGWKISDSLERYNMVPISRAWTDRLLDQYFRRKQTA